jgi:hypothetical protein
MCLLLQVTVETRDTAPLIEPLVSALLSYFTVERKRLGKKVSIIIVIRGIHLSLPITVVS